MHLPYWKKLAFGVFTAAALLLLAEGCLAWLGVHSPSARRDPFVGFHGASRHFQQRVKVGHPPQLCTDFGKLGYVNDQAFAAQKPATTFRIFCLGGSTTFGRPYDDATSFVGWLRTLLQLAAPEQDWEVVNASGVSYASYRVAAVMEELVEYQPDLFIIYTGHNEFLEDRTYGHVRDRPAAGRWLTQAAHHSRVAGLIDRVLNPPAQGAPLNELPEEVDTILDHTIGPTSYTRDDARRKHIVAHFELSISRMVDLARAAGADVVFVRPACNLKDCSPFKSESKAGLTGEQQRAWQSAFQRGQRLQQEDHHHEAIEAFDEAVAIDRRHASSYYLLGKSQWAVGRYDEAGASLARAVDEDVCPLRMTSDLGEAIDRVVSASGAATLDMQALLARHSREAYGHTVLGNEYFLDHVHPTIAAHGMLAVALTESLREQGVFPCEVQWSSRQLDTVRERVEATTDSAARARAEGNLARVLYWAGKVDEAGPLALNSHQHEDDPRLLLVAGVYLDRQGHTERALELLERAKKVSPEDERIHKAIAAVQSRASSSATPASSEDDSSQTAE